MRGAYRLARRIMNRLDRLALLSVYLDGELSDADRRWLAAWSEGHPEDRHDFEALAEVVRLVRELPEAQPPAGLRERILRACAEAVPLEVPRDTALGWLDKYLDGELPAPQSAVVEHYMAVDAEFAETAAVHQRMLDVLGDVEEVEPPRELRRRIEADVERMKRGALPLRRRRPQPAYGLLRRPWFATAALAAVILLAVGLINRGKETPPSRVAEDPSPAYVTPDQVDDSGVIIAPAPADVPVVIEEHGEGIPLGVPADDDAPVIEQDLVPEPPQVAPITPRPPVGNIAQSEREPAQPVRPTPRREPLPPKAGPDAAPAPLPGAGGGGALANGEHPGESTTEMIDRTGTGSVLGGNPDPGSVRPDSGGAVDPTRGVEVPPF